MKNKEINKAIAEICPQLPPVVIKNLKRPVAGNYYGDAVPVSDYDIIKGLERRCLRSTPYWKDGYLHICTNSVVNYQTTSRHSACVYHKDNIKLGQGDYVFVLRFELER